MRFKRLKFKPSSNLLGAIVPLLIAAGIALSSASVSGDLLEFTHVPPYGSTEDLLGCVHMVNPDSHVVAVYIYIEGMGWWTKPYPPCSGIGIRSDSTWQADITTRANDEYASAICAFLLPLGVDCPTMAGEEDLPEEIFERCIDAICTTRVTRTISFSGYEWGVRKSYEPVSPDSNFFSDSTDNVWVDGQDRLHLMIRQRIGLWFSSEVVLDHPLGYGTYIFQVDSKIGDMDKNVVLGMFIYDSDAWMENHREMDLEFAYWGDSTYPNAQFVVQPWEQAGNIYRWAIPPSVKSSTHSFHWTSDSIRFVSARGNQSVPPFDSILSEWTYTNVSGIPEPGDERATLNLWLFGGMAPSDGNEPEVIITNFRHFTPTAAEEYEASSSPQFRLLPNHPNPFSKNTVIGFQSYRVGRVVLRVTDVSGRVVRTLLNEERSTGSHYVLWDGRDDRGETVNSGVYFSHLEAGPVSHSSKMVLIR